MVRFAALRIVWPSDNKRRFSLSVRLLGGQVPMFDRADLTGREGSCRLETKFQAAEGACAGASRAYESGSTSTFPASTFCDFAQRRIDPELQDAGQAPLTV